MIPGRWDETLATGQVTMDAEPQVELALLAEVRSAIVERKPTMA